MKTVKEIKNKIKKNKCRGKNFTKVITLKRGDFKKKLSTSVGFGFQDLKREPRKLVTELIIKNYNVHFIPKGDVSDMVIKVIIKH